VRDAWRARDPIDRFEALLADRGLWDQDYGERIREEREARAREAAETALEIVDSQSPAEVFDEVYADPPPVIDEQRAEFEALYKEFGESAFRGW
jgi:pyruvate dehydrogenase E1 component alpha subunit